MQELRQIAASKDADLVLARQGARHEIYILRDVSLPIPRHREIAEGTAKTLIKAAKGA
ncbi:addiction module toxin, HicA family [Streptomyces alkaliphilus]|uniref:Addiction module toxin, HicA family n=1 Tax=Streptomyces alkaliphilus TaxID=1472722 RepID=A0A7W3Y0R3_9ACTN|nr:addiction module toxin, HicA family [Streptomyces alkaliphilus]